MKTLKDSAENVYPAITDNSYTESRSSWGGLKLRGESMGLFELLAPRPIQDREEFKDAEHFQRTIRPLEDTEYSWVFAYSKDLYERYRTIYKDLDDKANGIIKYLGGGAGLFALAALVNVTTRTAPIVSSAMPSFVASLLSVLFAVVSRQPHAALLPPSAAVAFGYANGYGDSEIAQAAFIGEWHRACVGLKLRIDNKAMWVRAATWLFFAAITLLSIPLIVATSAPRGDH